MQKPSNKLRTTARMSCRFMEQVRFLAVVSVFLVGAALMTTPAHAAHYDDDEVAQGFYKTVFGAEIKALSWGGQSKRVKKYVAPVKVWIDNRARLNRLRNCAPLYQKLAHQHSRPSGAHGQ